MTQAVVVWWCHIGHRRQVQHAALVVRLLWLRHCCSSSSIRVVQAAAAAVLRKSLTTCQAMTPAAPV